MRFDADWYLERYPLAAEEVQAGLASDALDHFERIGWQRGYIRHYSAPRYEKDPSLALTGFWTDKPNALEALELKIQRNELVASDSALFRQFILDGYMAIKKAVPTDVIDAAARDLDAIYSGARPNAKFTLSTKLESWNERMPIEAAKAVDIHMISEDIRNAVYHEGIMRLVRGIFETGIHASQSLGFYRGSAQRIHQDTAYVTYSRPLQFVGVWLAMEDIEPDSGELEYLIGSHRMQRFQFPGGHVSIHEALRIDPTVDRQKYTEEYLRYLSAQEQSLAYTRVRYYPKKGDALIWAAELAHGGTPISLERTRKSVVIRACPKGVAPTYFENSKRRVFSYNESVTFSNYAY